MTTERRKHPRFELNQVMDLTFGKERLIQAEGVNISAGGVLCRTEEFCEAGTRVSLLITVAVKKKEWQIPCEGVVIRSQREKQRYDTAISFTDMSDDAARHFHDFIKLKHS